MARGNMVIMLGMVTSKPFLQLNSEGEFKTGRITLLTMRRSGLNNQQRLAGAARADEQLVMSRDSYLIEHKMANLEEKDFVLIKGSLSTREVPKKVRCPECGEVNIQPMGVIVYVDPLTITKIGSAEGMSTDELTKYLIKNAEFSNYIACFGTLVREPRYAPDYGVTNRRECNIQVALNRKRLIVEDGPDKKTDYPYIRAFGKIAEESAKVLHTGSEIYVEGAIEARTVTLTKICPTCSCEFEADTKAVEIVPYSMEYISSDIDTSLLVEEDTDNTEQEESEDSEE